MDFLENLMFQNALNSLDTINTRQARSAAATRAAVGLVHLSHHISQLQAHLDEILISGTVINQRDLESLGTAILQCKEQYDDARYVIDPPPESIIEQWQRKRRRNARRVQS